MDTVIRYIVGVLAVFLVAPQVVEAAQTNPFRATGPVVDSSGFSNVRTTFVTRTPASNQAFYTTRTVAFSRASVGAVARSAVGGPAGVAITAAIIAAGYVFDGNGDPVDPGIPGISGNGSCQPGGGGVSTRTAAECVAVYGPQTFRGHIVQQDGLHKYYWLRQDWYDAYGLSQPPTASRGFSWRHDPNGADPSPTDPAGTPDHVLSDSEFGTIIAENFPELIPDLITNSFAKGDWPTTLPEVEAPRQTVEGSIGQDVEGVPDPAYDPTVIISSNPGEVPQSDSGSSETTEPTELEFPPACEWFDVLCEFLDWMQEETDFTDQPQLPIDEQSIDFDDYDSGLPTTSTCPSPQTVTLSVLGNNSFDVSYQPFCDFATQIRPLVLIAAYLLAVFLFVRGAR